MKSGKETAGRDNLVPCENITITNCTMAHGHGGVVIGSEMSGGRPPGGHLQLRLRRARTAASA